MSPRRPADGLLELQRLVGNHATVRIVQGVRRGATPVVQRLVLTMGQPATSSDDADAIAKQTEIEVAAETIVGDSGQQQRPFDPPAPPLDAGRNYVVSHSDGSRIWGQNSPRYGARKLADQLRAWGVATGMEIRLTGCNTADGPESLAAETAKELRTPKVQGTVPVIGVTIRGQKGEKLWGPTTRGVYQSGVRHSGLNAALAKRQENISNS